MKLLNLRKLTFLTVLLSSIAFSHNTLADKDPNWDRNNIYGGGGDGAGDFQIEGGDQSLQDLTFPCFHGHYSKQQDSFLFYTPLGSHIQVKNAFALDCTNLYT